MCIRDRSSNLRGLLLKLSRPSRLSPKLRCSPLLKSPRQMCIRDSLVTDKQDICSTIKKEVYMELKSNEYQIECTPDGEYYAFLTDYHQCCTYGETAEEALETLSDKMCIRDRYSSGGTNRTSFHY